MKKRVALFAVAAAIAGGALRAAEKPKLSAADTAAFATFRLSLEGVRKVAAANRDFRRIEKMSPGLKAKLETPEGEAPQSLDDSVRRVEGVPQAIRVLRKNHITARDYLLTTMTLFGATMMAAVEKETGKPASLPDSLARENVNFVKMNEEELAKLGPEIFQTGEEKSPASR